MDKKQTEEAEICTLYRDCKNKKKEIKILQELYCKSREEIVDILRRGGQMPEKTSKKAISSKETAKNVVDTAENVVEKPEKAAERVKMGLEEEKSTKAAEKEPETIPETVLDACKDRIIKLNADKKDYIEIKKQLKLKLQDIEQDIKKCDQEKQEIVDFCLKNGKNIDKTA